MEVYTCDSVSYVICRNLAFLMLDLKTKMPFFVKERTALFMLCSRAGWLLVYVFISSLCRGAERRHPGGVRQSLRKVSSGLRRYLIPTRVSNGLLFPD